MTRSPHPPDRLPRGLHPLWRALHRAEKTSETRADLARRLGVSTHTLQRLLVDGRVPRFGRTSTRQTLAWARTIARLADQLGGNPRTWIEGAGILWTERVARACNTAVLRASVSGRRSVAPRFEPQPGSFARSLAREVARALTEKREPARSGVSPDHSAHCQSCSQPLSEHAGPSPDYCRYCADETGRLRPREEVHALIARWMESWQPRLTRDEALRRATLYMSAMPAWTRSVRPEEAS